VARPVDARTMADPSGGNALPRSRATADLGEGAQRWPLGEARTVVDSGGQYPPTEADPGRSRTPVGEFRRRRPIGEFLSYALPPPAHLLILLLFLWFVCQIRRVMMVWGKQVLFVRPSWPGRTLHDRLGTLDDMVLDQQSSTAHH
jgi:hypothetical protein